MPPLVRPLERPARLPGRVLAVAKGQTPDQCHVGYLQRQMTNPIGEESKASENSSVKGEHHGHLAEQIPP